MANAFNRDVIADGARGRGENMVLAIIAGLVAAAIGAGLWMAVEVGLNAKIGFVALGVGALVGFAIRLAGNGHSFIYGIIGAVFTLGGCLAGEVLANLYAASSAQQPFLELARSVDYSQMISTIFAKMDPIGYLIYGIGVFEGYKLSIVK